MSIDSEKIKIDTDKYTSDCKLIISGVSDLLHGKYFSAAIETLPLILIELVNNVFKDDKEKNLIFENLATDMKSHVK